MHPRERLLGKSLWPALVVLLAFSGVAQAQNELDGTWRLIMRQLPDGTKQEPPAVLGVGTSHNGLTNLNVFWHTPEGKPAFFARISTFKMSDTEYTETLLFSVLDDGSGKPPTYNLKGGTEKTPVTHQGSRIAFKLPFDEPAVVVVGDKMTATREGQFVDYWDRVR